MNIKETDIITDLEPDIDITEIYEWKQINIDKLNNISTKDIGLNLEDIDLWPKRFPFIKIGPFSWRILTLSTISSNVFWGFGNVCSQILPSLRAII